VIIPPVARLGQAALYLIGAGTCFLFMVMTAAIAGPEVLSLYLHSSYRAYPLIILGLPGATGLICLVTAALSVRAAFRGGDARPHASLQVAAALLLCACVVTAGLFLRQQARRYSGAPSARKDLHGFIGPFAHFGPFAGRRADASNSMVVWYFDTAQTNAPTELEYGLDYPAAPATRLREAPGGDGRRHEFHLAGLAPGTRYRYRVPRPDAAWRTFSTGPGRGVGLRFLCLADTGNTIARGGTFSYYGEVTRAAAYWYRAAGLMPLFMVHGGDAVRAGTDLDGWRAAFASNELAGSLPLVNAPGNHEFLEDGGANFRYLYGTPDYCSIDCGDCRVIVLNPYDGPGRTLDGPVICTGADQYRWVQCELARPRDGKWLVVVMHNPVLSTGDYGTGELLAAQYFSLFRKHAVDLVIAGHDHNFDSFLAAGNGSERGTLYLVVGTGGSHLDSGIMDRRERRWLDWRHDRRSPSGLYQHDSFTERYHRYGELSWGFTDVEVAGEVMTVTYHRWLSLPRFLEITGQDRKSWDLVKFDGSGPLKSPPIGTEAAWTARKIRGRGARAGTGLDARE
jgi:hypothetical protein